MARFSPLEKLTSALPSKAFLVAWARAANGPPAYARPAVTFLRDGSSEEWRAKTPLESGSCEPTAD